MRTTLNLNEDLVKDALRITRLGQKTGPRTPAPVILADSSVWIEHLRRHDRQLANLLVQEKIVIHSMVVGELACGSLANRDAALWRWRRLPQLTRVK